MSDVTNVVKLSSLAQTNQVDASGRILYLGNDGVAYIVAPTDILIENENGAENKPKYKITVSNAEKLGNKDADDYATKSDLSSSEAAAKNLANATGTLTIAKGGTGKTTAKAAQNALLSDMTTVTSAIDDSTDFVMKYGTPSDSTGAIFKRSATLVWNYIMGKISSVLNLTKDSYSGKAATAGTADTAKACSGNAATATTASACSGNAATATKATQDANGNNIASTYLTKTDASSTYLGKTATAARATSDANGKNIANTYQTKTNANVTAALENGTTLVLTIH